jgi:SP family myo-inositol transporter-like MFS transporter 13
VARSFPSASSLTYTFVSCARARVESRSIWLAALSSLSQIVGVVLSVIFVDKLGRRVLVLGSLVLISFCMLGLGASFYLARIGSSPVDLTSPLLDPDCASQPALLWNGITSYCYDCIQIDGCGFCQGACVQGDVFGPTEDTCPDDSYAKAACTNPYGWMPIVFMIGFLISYGVGMAGLPWTINSEIYPSSCKSRAISLSTGTMWLSNLVISTSFLTISSPSVLTTYGEGSSCSLMYFCYVSEGILNFFLARCLLDVCNHSIRGRRLAFCCLARDQRSILQRD